MQTQVQNETIENSIELAKLYGILKYLPDGQLTHAPFSLSPYKISAVDLQEKSQTSIDVTDMKKSQSHIKIGILSTGENSASSVFLSSAAGFTLPSGSRKKEGF